MFKYDIGQVCEVTLAPKFSGDFGKKLNEALKKQRGGPDLVTVVWRRMTKTVPEYTLIPYPEPDDLPDDYSRSLYEHFLLPY